MRRVSICLATATVAALLTATASASATPPFWWWTPAKAKKGLVWSNPQAWGGGHTTILQANGCLGLGRVRRVGQLRYYRDFRCAIVWRDDDAGTGPFTGKMFFRTSKIRRYGVACYSPYRYATVLALGCP